MKKTGEIFIVLGVITIFTIAAVLFSFTGVKNGGQNYIRLEVNPKIEFVTNSHDKVVTVFPINAEAKELIINEEFIGLKIEDATKKFLELCTALNYLDVERTDNAIKLTVISGFTQALEVKLYREIDNYFVNNEIMAVIIENSSDLQISKQAKKLGVSNGKYALIESAAYLFPDLAKEELKKLNEKQLINKIKTAHGELNYGVQNYSQTEINDKSKLIDFNRLKLTNHKQSITNKTQSKFKENYVKSKKKVLKNYEINYEKMYETWKLNRINAAIA